MRGRGRDLPSATASGSPDKSPTVEDAATRSKRKQKYWTPGALAFVDGDRGKEEERRIQENETQVKRPLPFRSVWACNAGPTWYERGVHRRIHQIDVRYAHDSAYGTTCMVYVVAIVL